MAALQRAVARRHDDDVAVLVGEALGLDVARLVEVLLDEALAAAEGADGLADGRLVEVGDLLDGARDLEAAAAAAVGRLDRDRDAVLLGEGDDLVGVVDRLLGAGDQRGAGPLGDVAGLDLVAEGVDGRRGRADPGEPGVDDRLGEAGVLGEEAVAGVDRVGAGLLGDGKDLVDGEVAVGRRAAVEGERLVGDPDVQRVAVGLGVDGDAGDARRPGRPGRPGPRSRRGWRSAPCARRDLPSVGWRPESRGGGSFTFLRGRYRTTHRVRPLTRCRPCPTCRAALVRRGRAKVIRTGLTASAERGHDFGARRTWGPSPA